MEALNALKNDGRFDHVRGHDDGTVTAMIPAAHLQQGRDVLRDEYNATIESEEQGSASGNRIVTLDLPGYTVDDEKVGTDMDADEAISMF